MKTGMRPDEEIAGEEQERCGGDPGERHTDASKGDEH